MDAAVPRSTPTYGVLALVKGQQRHSASCFCSVISSEGLQWVRDALGAENTEVSKTDPYLLKGKRKKIKQESAHPGAG